MDFDEIKQILDMMREHELAEFELERDNFKLRVRKNAAGHVVAAPMSVPQAVYPPYPPHAAAPPSAAAAAAPTLTAADEEMELAVVKSPIVGTFYTAPEPGARPYAQVG